MKGLSSVAKLQLYSNRPSKSDFIVSMSLSERMSAQLASYVNRMFTRIDNFTCEDNGITKILTMQVNDVTSIIEFTDADALSDINTLTVTEFTHQKNLFDLSLTYQSFTEYKNAMSDLIAEYSEYKNAKT